MKHRPVEILLVEDNPSDRVLTERALREVGVLNVLHTVGDGGEALRFVRREGHHADAPRPDLVLLDLDLPETDGHSVLRELRGPEHQGHPHHRAHHIECP